MNILATIKSTIELYDAFSGPLMDITSAVDSSIDMMDQLQATMARPVDVSPMQTVQQQLDDVINTARQLDAAMQSVSAPSDMDILKPDPFIQNVQSNVEPVVTNQPELDIPESVKIPVIPIVSGQPEIETPEQIKIPVIPEIAQVPELDLPEAVSVPVSPFITDEARIETPEQIQVPVIPIVGEQAQIETPESVNVPVNPVITSQPEIEVPDGIEVPVVTDVTQPVIDAPESIEIPVITDVQQPEINVPDEVQVPIVPVMDGQPQVSAPDDITVSINPVVTEQPQINVPDEITVPVSTDVQQPQFDIPQEIEVDVTTNVEQPQLDFQPVEIPVVPVVENQPQIGPVDTTGIRDYQFQIDTLASMLQKVSSAQEAISAQSNSISILPDGAEGQLAGINLEISRMEAALALIQQNPLQWDSETTRLQIIELNNSILKTAESQKTLNSQLQEMAAIPPPVWKSDTFDVFTNSGIERFQDEVQSANRMLNTLNETQSRIAQTAATTAFFPPDMISDMAGIESRLEAIKGRIEDIENNPLNLGTDQANTQLEQLRTQLEQAVNEQEALNQAVDNLDVRAANEAYLRLSHTVHGTERFIRDNVDEQGKFNQLIQEGTDNALDLQNAIGKMAGVFAGILGVSAIRGFIQECTEAYDGTVNAQTQLISVLANMMDADYVAQFEIDTTADTAGAIDEINSIQNNIDTVEVPVTAETRALTHAYDQIVDKANEIESRGIYDAGSMTAAAAEFATYFTDVDAITSMMDTLSNYAMGMSGGGMLDSTAMVDYATNLGKIMSGAYDAMTKKGFEFTDAQKAIIEGEATREQIVNALGEEYVSMSDDMKAAAVISQIIDESWADLYETMSNTPQGKIIQLTNSLNGLKDTMGGELYPYIILIVDTINSNWPTIIIIADGITTALQMMLGVLSTLFNVAFTVADAIISHWSLIAPIIGCVTAALIAYIAAVTIYNTVMAISAAIETASAFAKQVHAAASAMATGATFAQTVAQYGLNAALLACPVTWIVIGIIAIIAAIYLAVAAINYFTGSTISATGIIMGAFFTLGAFIANIFILLWNVIASFIEFLVNVWKNPEYAIKAFAVNVAVAFLNFCLACVTGTQGAIGAIVGIWYAFVQIIENVIAAIWNFFAAGIEAIVNAWNSGVYQVKSFLIGIAPAALSVAQSVASSMGSAASNIANMFIGAANKAIGAINWIIDALNMIPGVDIGKVSELSAVSWDFGASKIADTASGLQGLLGSAPDKWTAPTLELGSISNAFDTGKQVGADLVSGLEASISGTITNLQASIADRPEDYWEAPKLDYINLSDAAKAGYEFGEGIDQKIAGFNPMSLT